MVKFWPKKKISDVLKFFPNSDFSKFYDIWVVKKDKIFTFNIIISHNNASYIKISNYERFMALLANNDVPAELINIL